MFPSSIWHIIPKDNFQYDTSTTLGKNASDHSFFHDEAKVWLMFVGCSCLSRILLLPKKSQFFLLAKILWQLITRMIFFGTWKFQLLRIQFSST